MLDDIREALIKHHSGEAEVFALAIDREQKSKEPSFEGMIEALETRRKFHLSAVEFLQNLPVEGGE